MMVRLFSLLCLASATLAADAELLCFGATWCQPCQQMKPTIARLQREGYAVHTIDIDRQPDVARRFGVSTVPCFIRVDQDGRPTGRLERATTYEGLRQLLDQQGPSARPNVRPRTIPPVGEKPLLQTAATSTSSAQPASPVGQTTTSNMTQAEAAALSSSVRLRVEDATGHSFGTGTVIDVHGSEALIVTCGHIFRESQGRGVIVIERFDRPNAQPMQGALISYDLKLDVALVSVTLMHPINVAKLADPQSPPAPRSEVFSVGCNHGQPPTVVRGQVNQVNKYLGPANITASGRPVDGRSGGGLFRRDGLLIGVCNAADPELDEGLYAALPRLCEELDRSGLSFVYRTTPAMASPPKVASPPPDAIARASLRRDDLVRPAAMAVEATVLQQQPLKSNTEELVCVVRSEEGHKTYVIKNPSRVLLEYLERENKRLK